MVKPYSNDLRARVVGAVEGGETVRRVAECFGVSVSSVVKWHQRYRSTGSIRPSLMGGNRGSALDEHRDFILEQIKRTPHLTLHGLAAVLGERGVRVSHNGVWLFLRREGLSFKKKPARP
jgi:transposase